MSHQVLVMDSGIGGLTVHREIIKLIPDITCHYLADNGFFPYGTKTEQALEERMELLIRRITKQHAIDAVVIACNSASTAVLDYLRERFEFPFIGVVPAIKPAAKLTKNKKIGLLATEGTVNRPYTDKLIAEFASDCEVIRVASQPLVTMAEMKLNGLPTDINALQEIIQPLINAAVDTCVLGCTHFPWFRNEFKLIAPYIEWIDSGEAIARRLEQVLLPIKDNCDKSSTDYPVFFYTGNSYEQDFTKNLSFNITKIEFN
ncbi:glutamate racemase [Pleionea sediminis]|uniref:glutamate racemase n=1 Tax=Pleionea sediminis TaxID=2569479 RepID=UPI001186FF93|nr:glutamate racemase [Pleionea sediminis]